MQCQEGCQHPAHLPGPALLHLAHGNRQGHQLLHPRQAQAQKSSEKETVLRSLDDDLKLEVYAEDSLSDGGHSETTARRKSPLFPD